MSGMSGIANLAGVGTSRNPAVGFADVLRQPAPCAPSDMPDLLRPEDLGTPMVRRNPMDIAPLPGVPGIHGSAGDFYSRSLMGMGGGGVGHGLNNWPKQHLPSLMSRQGGMTSLGGGEVSSVGHGGMWTTNLSTPTSSMLTPVLGNLQSGQLANTNVFHQNSDVLVNQVSDGYYLGNQKSDVSSRLAATLGLANQLQHAANSTSMQLAQLIAQAQQAQQVQQVHHAQQALAHSQLIDKLGVRQSLQAQQAQNVLAHSHSLAHSLPCAGTRTDPHLVGLLQQMNEQYTTTDLQSARHGVQMPGPFSLNRGHVSLADQLRPDNSHLSLMQAQQTQQAFALQMQHAGDCHSFDASGASASAAEPGLDAWNGKLLFSTVLAKGHTDQQQQEQDEDEDEYGDGVWDENEDEDEEEADEEQEAAEDEEQQQMPNKQHQDTQRMNSSTIQWGAITSTIGDAWNAVQDLEDQNDAKQVDETSALMALAEFAGKNAMSAPARPQVALKSKSTISDVPAQVQVALKYKKQGSEEGGKRRKQAKIPRLSGPIHGSEGGSKGEGDVERQHFAKQSTLLETATALVAMATAYAGDSSRDQVYGSSYSHICPHNTKDVCACCCLRQL